MTKAWVLTCDERTLSCVLEERASSPIAVAVRIDGTEIATRTCRTRSEATWYAAFLFNRLIQHGWSVRTGLSRQLLH